MLSLLPAHTPKLSVREKRAVAYPYYAGYSETFVRETIEQLAGGRSLSVLDPWNGSGTTTYVACNMGHKATGIDLNPVLSIVARARMASSADRQALVEASEKCCRASVSADTAPFVALASQCRMIAAMLNLNIDKPFSPRSSLLLCGAFVTSRQLAAQSLSKNPTWFKSIPVASLKHTIPVPELLLGNLRFFFSSWQDEGEPDSNCDLTPHIRTGNILTLELPTSSFDLVLTSPPYLTRLDYVKSSMPEIHLLGELGWRIDPSDLRGRMIGSPLVGASAPKIDAAWGDRACSVLRAVESHPSKASGGYYLRFYIKYFHSMFRAVQRINHALKPGGSAVIVAQSSHYKEMFIDLPAILIDFADAAGFRGRQRLDFEQSRSIVSKNTRAGLTGSARRVVESVVVVDKP